MQYLYFTQIIYDKGSGLMRGFGTMISNDYRIFKYAITVRDPQANAMIERIH